MKPTRTMMLALYGATFLAGQAAIQPLETSDPYTAGDRELVDAAGYVGFGPTKLGGYHSTEDVDELLGTGRVLWLETQHFKIGTILPPYRMPNDRHQRAKIRGELAELKKVLPAVDLKTRMLDPWLRTHLIARRCETAYEQFLDLVGCSDRDFPDGKRPPIISPNWMGIGPYLGQRDKYVVLITSSAGDLGRYTQKFMGETVRWPKRYNMGWYRGLFFGTALEFPGRLGDDSALHCHLVYNLVQNFCDGYRHFNHEIPVWFKCGLAQSFLREIDPRHNNYDRPPNGEAPDGRLAWKWDRTVRGLVKHEATTPLETMGSWRDYSEFRYQDYAVAWSRVEFLRNHSDHGIGNFLHAIKMPITNGKVTPEWDAVLAHQDQALNDAFEFENLAALDRAWKAWVARP